MKLKHGLFLTFLSLSLLSCENGLWGEDENNKPDSNGNTIYLYENSYLTLDYPFPQIKAGKQYYGSKNLDQIYVQTYQYPFLPDGFIRLYFGNRAIPGSVFNFQLKVNNETEDLDIPLSVVVKPMDLFDHFISSESDTIRLKMKTYHSVTFYLTDKNGKTISKSEISKLMAYSFNIRYSIPELPYSVVSINYDINEAGYIYFVFYQNYTPDTPPTQMTFNFKFSDKEFSVPITLNN
ncbi:MAG: hypothetical protein LCH54_02740 [Bacteroidetes bacterium]|nr:hypothetical protein [Bacteroidota bacterium]